MNKPNKMILTAGPSISKKEINYVLDAIKNGWNEKWSEYLEKFEKAFADYVGVKYAMATSSCTGAMHLTLKAIGLKENDEVIVPEITWVATAAVVTYCGAKPVFADVDPDTWCISQGSIKKNISKRTKAIIPVHNYGNPCDMDEIRKIAKEYNLFILEDAAPSLGAIYKGKKTGSMGDAAAFSLQGAKIATSGEGGMFLTNDKKLYEKVKKLGDHGRSLTKALWNDEIGFKYKMSNIQAALGLAQLERIEDLVAKKRLIFSWYKKNLEDIEGLRLNVEHENTRNIYWMPTIVLDKNFGIARDKLIIKLKENLIDCRPVFYPLSSLPMFQTQEENINAIHLSKNGINLPAGYNRTRKEIDYICFIIKKFLRIK
ncbi:MAG: DegT/DnrJ/EryC1/StrS family aminotransferase [Candidatus Margulisbacteria bacterium]|nr:DegT/DnrJ/EryC1/StrS family aminotransferase [Candidatus Margulisiibacteriota bacterium]